MLDLYFADMPILLNKSGTWQLLVCYSLSKPVLVKCHNNAFRNKDTQVSCYNSHKHICVLECTRNTITDTELAQVVASKQRISNDSMQPNLVY